MEKSHSPAGHRDALLSSTCCFTQQEQELLPSTPVGSHIQLNPPFGQLRSKVQVHVDHPTDGCCVGMCWYSLQRRAAPASLAHHAPPAAPVGRGDLGSPSHRVSPHPPRAQGSRAHPECLAVGKGERRRGVSSCRGSKGGSCRAAVGFGDTQMASTPSLTCPFGPGSPDSPWGWRT